MKKKKRNIFLTVIQIIIFIYAISMAFFVMLVGSRVDSYYENVFSQNYFSVNYNGMHPNLTVDDVLITKKHQPTDVLTGDYVTYFSRNANTFSEVIIGEVKLKEDISGVLFFEVEGYDGEFNEIVKENDILGVYQGEFNNAKAFFTFLNSFIGYLVLVIIPFLILLVFRFIRIRKYLRFEDEEKVKEEKEEERKVKLEVGVKTTEKIVSHEDKKVPIDIEMSGIDFKELRIQRLTTGELLKTYLIIKGDEKTRYWSTQASDMKSDILVVPAEFLYNLIKEAIQYFYEKKSAYFEKQFNYVINKYSDGEIISYDDLLTKLNEHKEDKYLKIIFNFFNIFIIDRNNYVLYANRDEGVIDKPQKHLQYKQRLKEQIHKEEKLEIKYKIVY